MPVIERDGLRIDYLEAGAGTPVVLLHSSVSGNRQWKRLVQDLKDRYQVIALNLFGYGETTPWRGPEPQTLADQARLVQLLVPDGPLNLVGHSFGGAVAMKAAALFGSRVSRLVLLEPNPFYLLRAHRRDAAYAEIAALRDFVRDHGAKGEWHTVAERFAEYWNGSGAWQAMPEDRRAAFARALVPNYHEWDAVMNENTPLEQWSAIRAATVVLCGRATRRPVLEMAELLRGALPHWSFATVEGGHMAPLTHPDLVNALVAKFLEKDR